MANIHIHDDAERYVALTEKKKTREQKDAEAAVDCFRKELGPFVVAAETTRMPMVFTDATIPDNPIVFANDAFLLLTGYDRAEVLAQSFTALMARGASDAALAQVKTCFEGTAQCEPVIHYRRKDSSEFWASVFVSPVRNESGEILQHFVSFIDLTKHREEQSRARMLIGELNHRVKNTLQAVQAIVSEAFRSAADPKAARQSIESRVFALSRSHDLLLSENWEGAGLHDLVKTALEPFTGVGGRGGRVVMTGPNLHLPPRATMALGVAFHELSMNAVKYGAFSTDAGAIDIEWAVHQTPKGPRIILHWREKGGPAVTPPTRKGFGTRVIEGGLANEMDGAAHLDFRADGVVCTIDIPVPRSDGKR